LTVDVTIFGNILVDTIYEVEQFSHGGSNIYKKKTQTVGGVTNVLAALKRMSPDLSTKLISAVAGDKEGDFIKEWLSDRGWDNLDLLTKKDVDSTTSSALIISDMSEKIRTSFVNWGECKNLTIPNNISSKWLHILYLDCLPLVEEKDLKRLVDCDIISADVCLSTHTEKEKERIFSLLKCLDYFFISDVEAKSLTGKESLPECATILGRKSKGYAIVHSPAGSSYSNGVATYSVDSIYIEESSINVLGAGDNFAARFIFNKIATKSTMTEVIKDSHDYTTNFLIQGNKS
tara:strand:+ start:25395 stop:26264 length:870 start_codon:yes stop_codon:yes gene_type:complete